MLLRKTKLMKKEDSGSGMCWWALTIFRKAHPRSKPASPVLEVILMSRVFEVVVEEEFVQVLQLETDGTQSLWIE